MTILILVEARYGSGLQSALAPDSCVEFDECSSVLRGRGHSHASWNGHRFIGSGVQHSELRMKQIVS